MTTGATSGGGPHAEDGPRTPATASEGGGAGASVPVASDRPVVDGAATSAEELAAEVEELSDERRQDVERLREEVGATAAELAARLDVPARMRARRDETVTAVRKRTRTAVAAAQRRAGQVRAGAADRAAPAVRALRVRRAAVAVGAAALLALVLARRWNGTHRPSRSAAAGAVADRFSVPGRSSGRRSSRRRRA